MNKINKRQYSYNNKINIRELYSVFAGLFSLSFGILTYLNLNSNNNKTSIFFMKELYNIRSPHVEKGQKFNMFSINL